MATLADFRGRHQDADIVVCGCGESLNLLDRPERFVTIGVNDVGRKFDPTYLVVVNPRHQFSGDRFRYVEQSRARYLFTQLDLGIDHSDIVKFTLGRYGGTTFDESNALHYTRNSPYVAICLAVHMGARRIGLIGVDFTDHHFFGRTGAHVLARRVSQIDAEYGRLAEACRAAGVELVNLSPSSRLTSVPRATLDAVDPVGLGPPTGRPSSVGTIGEIRRRIFFVNYRFQSCGDVFATGLAHAAEALGLEYEAAWWDDRALLSKIRAFAPDLVFVVHGRKAAAQWGAALREWKTAVWLLDEPYEVDDTARWSSQFGTVFGNDRSTRDRHQRWEYLPACYDPRVHTPCADRRPHAVGFIGGAGPARERLLAALAGRGLLSYVVGGPWRSAAINAVSLGEKVPPSDTSRLYQQTRIVVNVFRDRHHFDRQRTAATSLNPRVYEATACGALVVSQWRPELDELVPEMPTFRTEAELVATIERLLTDDAAFERIRAACAARLAPHTYTQRLRTIMDKTLDADASLGAARAPLPGDAWIVCEPVGYNEDAGAFTLESRQAAQPGSERGLASRARYDRIAVSFEAMIPSGACFIAKVHQSSRDDQLTNSYHLYCDAGGSAYLARHHCVLGHVSIPRDRWTKIALQYADGVITVACDDVPLLRAYDRLLTSGFVVLSVKGGAVQLRHIELTAPPAAALSEDPIASDHVYGTLGDAAPRVSIVTTVFDRVECLERCLRSVNALAYRDIEQIVVSDAPGPDVVAAIASAVRAHDRGHLRYYNLTRRHNNWGIAPAEVGLRRSRGDFVCFLSDDNGYTPDHVGTLVKALDRDRTLGFVYSSCRYAGRLVLSHPVPAAARIDLGQPMFRRELFAQFFDNRLPFDMMAWDWALIHALVDKGVRWQHINVPSFIFRLAAYPHLIASGA